MSESITAPVSGGSSIPLPQPGKYLLYCYSIIVIGDIPGYQDKYQKKIIFIFELPHTKAVFNEAKGEQPFVVHRMFTLSMHKQSHLRPFLSNWIGAPIEDKDAEGFEITGMINKAAHANIIHGMTKTTNKTFLDIHQIGPAFGEQNLPPRHNPKIIWTWNSAFDPAKFLSIPLWIRNDMIKSKEFANLGIPIPVGEGEFYNQQTMKVERMKIEDQAQVQVQQAAQPSVQPPVQSPVQQQPQGQVPVQQVQTQPQAQPQPQQPAQQPPVQQGGQPANDPGWVIPD